MRCPEDATNSKQTPASELSTESSSEHDDDTVTGSSSPFYPRVSHTQLGPPHCLAGQQMLNSFVTVFEFFVADSLKHAADIRLRENTSSFLVPTLRLLFFCQLQAINDGNIPVYRKSGDLKIWQCLYEEKRRNSQERVTRQLSLDDAISDHRTLLQETEASSSLRVERVNPSRFHRVFGFKYARSCEPYVIKITLL